MAGASSGAHIPRSVPEAFDDLVVRFLNNLPEEELRNSERLFFQLEQAWWFYEDFLADEYDHLQHFRDFDDFSAAMFQHYSLLRPLIPRYSQMREEFKQYMRQIPVYGAVLLTPDLSNVLLVQSFHGKYWGFPKGKVNQSERPVDCAVREVYEEVGFDGRQHVNESDYLENVTKQGKKTGMFIMKDVPPDFAFEPRVRKEIAGIQWFPIDSLPTHRDAGDTNKRKFNLHGFVPKLKKWIWRQQRASRTRQHGSRQRGRQEGSWQFTTDEQMKEDTRGRRRDNTKEQSSAQRGEKPKAKMTRNAGAGQQQLFRLDAKAVMDAMEPFLSPIMHLTKSTKGNSDPPTAQVGA